jgi:hypothetical protein
MYCEMLKLISSTYAHRRPQLELVLSRFSPIHLHTLFLDDQFECYTPVLSRLSNVVVVVVFVFHDWNL